jgi:hypothetical protein
MKKTQEFYIKMQTINERSSKVQIKLIQEYGLISVMKYITKPDKKVQKWIVQNDFFLVDQIKELDEEFQIMLMNKKSAYIKLINNQTELVQKMALLDNFKLIFSVNNPTEEVQLIVWNNKQFQEELIHDNIKQSIYYNDSVDIWKLFLRSEWTSPLILSYMIKNPLFKDSVKIIKKHKNYLTEAQLILTKIK